MAYAWFDAGNGRKVYRKVREATPSRRSSLSAPQLVRPFAEPVQSMADGGWYDDPGSLRATYRASNNPAGVDYIELGNERMEWKPAEFSEKERREDIRRSLHDVMSGNVSPEISAIE